MNSLSVVMAGIIGFALSGCATVIEGTDQTLEVTTAPVVGAECNLTGPSGSYRITTPDSVTIPRTQRDLYLECDKEGYEHNWATVQSHFNGAMVGNVLVGGLIGVGIDAATGAGYTFPTVLPLPMEPTKGRLAPAVAAEANDRPVS